MALIIKPHTVTVDLPEEIVSANILLGYGADPQGSVQCQVTPASASAIYDKFKVDTGNGAVLLCDDTDAAKFTTGGRVVWDGAEYSVAAEPKVHKGSGPADNAEVALELRD